MSYLQKYLKYKLKYLKLNLVQMEKTKIGGLDIIINWPEEYEKIKKDDELEMIIDETTKENLTNIKNKLSNIDPIYGKGDFVTKGKVRESNNNNTIELYNDDDETLYHAEDFPQGVKFKKNGQNIEDPNQFIKNNHEITKIKEQIIELEKKFNQLENKLDNHYHILPTSGMKQFENLHPYYNKKIN